MSSLPEWLRDTIPGWVFLCVGLWLVLQRSLEHKGNQPSPVKPYGRPAKDWRIVCLNIGLIGVSLVQFILGPAPGSVNSTFQSITQTILAVVLVIGAALTLTAAWIKDEWWSIGLELAGCVGLGTAYLVYTLEYFEAVDEWQATIGAWFTGSLLIGNLLRAVQLYRRAG